MQYTNIIYINNIPYQLSQNFDNGLLHSYIKRKKHPAYRRPLRGHHL